MSGTVAGKSAPELREEFVQLLDERRGEQVYQASMERNTRLIPREFVQNHGLHFDLVLRKLAFGADYVSDFFYMSKSSDDWNLVFVEIEKPQSRYFRDNSNEFHPDFLKGLQQIGMWRAWLSDPANLAGFLTQLQPIRLPLTMTRNPSYPKFVLVHGRRAEYHANDVRRALVRAQERDDFRTLSFDSLVEGLAHKHDCYVGVRHNEYVELLGDKIISAELFGSIEPTAFKVSKALRDAMLARLPEHCHVQRITDNGMVKALPWIGERIRTLRRPRSTS